MIGVGADNKFGHPNNEVLERLKEHKTKIYRTDKMGEIIIKCDGNNYMILYKQAKEGAELPLWFVTVQIITSQLSRHYLASKKLEL